MSALIDCDAHVIEGRELIGELLSRFPDHIRLSRPGEDGAFMIEGRPYPKSTGPGAGCPAAEGLNPAAQPFTPEGVLADCDREGIDVTVFFPSVALGLPSIRDQRFAGEFARLYNRWLATYCQHDPTRLHGVAMIPVEDVGASIHVMREAKELGLKGVMIPAVLRERNLDHPDLDPLFAAAADLDLPLGVHGAPGIHLPPLGSERFDNYLQVHVVSFPFDMMVAATALVLGGVFERHPRLRVGLFESGIGWVPYLVERLHEHHEKRGRLAPGCRRDPAEYVARGQLYVSCEGEDAMLPAAVDALGARWILWASDYPHWDSSFPEASRPLRSRTDLAESAKARIMHENARVFFGLG